MINAFFKARREGPKSPRSVMDSSQISRSKQKKQITSTQQSLGMTGVEKDIVREHENLDREY